MNDTIFSPMNIMVTLLLLICVPLFMYWIGKRKFTFDKLPQPILLVAEIEIYLKRTDEELTNVIANDKAAEEAKIVAREILAERQLKL